MTGIGILILIGVIVAPIIFLMYEYNKTARMQDELLEQHREINRRWDIILFHTRQLSARFSEIHAESNRRWEELERERRKE